MITKRNEDLKRFINFLGYDLYNNLEEMKLKKGQEIHLSGLYIVTEGDLEYFYLGENGECIKTATCSPEKFLLIGAGKYFNIEQLCPFYRVKSNVVLKEIPSKILDDLMENSNFNEWFIQLNFKYLGELLQDLFLRRTASIEEFIKHLLKKETSKKNTFTSDSIFQFVENHNLNRSTFYKVTKRLEKSGLIKKSKKNIKLLY